MRKLAFLLSIQCLAILVLNPLYSEGKMPFTLTSPNFKHLSNIPKKYTCEGEDSSPALKWQEVPEGTMSLALIADDPDAPDPEAPKKTWVHWVLYNIPPKSSGLKEGISPKNLPTGTKVGINDSGKKGYGGPCPPIGRHRYFFKLYALDAILDISEQDVRKPQLEAAMEGHIIAETQLMGTYIKQQ